MHKLCLYTSENARYLSLLEAHPLPNCQLVSHWSQADIILADPPLIAPKLAECTSLRWLQSTYAGVNAITALNTPFDFTLTRMASGFGVAMGEYVFGLWLAHYRRWQSYQTQQTQSHWQAQPAETLEGKTLLILGGGEIAQSLAKQGQTFGVTTWAVNTTGRSVPHCAQSFVWDELPQIAAQVDMVVNLLPDTPQTRGILDLAFFQSFQQVDFFNVGRGTALVDDDLIRAIEDGCVRHAFLDVFHTEPLPQPHPFWQHPNITVTPHIAAVSDPRKVVNFFRENVERWQNHQPLNGIVDWQKGY